MKFFLDTIFGLIVGVILTALSYVVSMQMGWVPWGVHTFLPVIPTDPNAPVPTSWCEIIGVVLNYACVFLVSRQSNANWPLGILAVVFLGILSYELRLFASMTLSLAYFLPIQFQGWYNWKYGGEGRTDLSVRQMAVHEYIIAAIALVVSWFVVVKVYEYFDAAHTHYDVGILVLSIVAQYLCNMKRPESWIFWGAVNVLSIYVYGTSGAYLWAFQYALFLLNVGYGSASWYLDLKAKGQPIHYGR